jgi:hypothetical protein
VLLSAGAEGIASVARFAQELVPHQRRPDGQQLHAQRSWCTGCGVPVAYPTSGPGNPYQHHPGLLSFSAWNCDWSAAEALKAAERALVDPIHHRRDGQTAIERMTHLGPGRHWRPMKGTAMHYT